MLNFAFLIARTHRRGGVGNLEGVNTVGKGEEILKKMKDEGEHGGRGKGDCDTKGISYIFTFLTVSFFKSIKYSNKFRSKILFYI